jgi:hypothetical protein
MRAWNIITDGNPINTIVFDPDGNKIWGIKQIDIKMDCSDYYSCSARIVRYVPYLWGDAGKNNVKSFFKLDESGNPIIVEETIRPVLITHPGMHPDLKESGKSANSPYPSRPIL